MKSTRPYLIRAIDDWIVENQQTPHLLVDAGSDQIKVPQQYVEDGMIVLNVSLNAVRDLDLGNEFVHFTARFSGKSYDISVPVDAVQAIYARENGQGIFLGDPGEDAERVESAAESGEDSAPESSDAEKTDPRRRAPHLTVVK
ncbi:MAG: ClpXP protease specificity-enhancing factor [Gammaproteobacteria bacterium]|nr:ClpXP protease specificity-enhancing factor [Gammaproteobacteria bacterium]